MLCIQLFTNSVNHFSVQKDQHQVFALMFWIDSEKTTFLNFISQLMTASWSCSSCLWFWTLSLFISSCEVTGALYLNFQSFSMHKVSSLFFDCSLASLLASAMLRESFDLRTSFCAFYLSASICSTAFLFSFCSLSRNMSSETSAYAMSALAFRTSWSLIERLSFLFSSAAL